MKRAIVRTFGVVSFFCLLFSVSLVPSIIAAKAILVFREYSVDDLKWFCIKTPGRFTICTTEEQLPVALVLALIAMALVARRSLPWILSSERLCLGSAVLVAIGGALLSPNIAAMMELPKYPRCYYTEACCGSKLPSHLLDLTCVGRCASHDSR